MSNGKIGIDLLVISYSEKVGNNNEKFKLRPVLFLFPTFNTRACCELAVIHHAQMSNNLRANTVEAQQRRQ